MRADPGLWLPAACAAATLGLVALARRRPGLRALGGSAAEADSPPAEDELRRLRVELERLSGSQARKLRETRDLTLLSMAKLAELRDGGSGAHLERIAWISARLASALARGGAIGIPEGFVEELFRSSPLHDLGKIAIPDAILHKRGPLSAVEWQIMKSHTTLGGEALEQIIASHPESAFLDLARDIAWYHHERWDGGGYPRGLAGEAIPLAARIVALADAYDAITSARPYKPAAPHEEALRRIRADSGRHFDPRLVELFLDVHGELRAIRSAHQSGSLQRPAFLDS